MLSVCGIRQISSLLVFVCFQQFNTKGLKEIDILFLLFFIECQPHNMYTYVCIYIYTYSYVALAALARLYSRFVEPGMRHWLPASANRVTTTVAEKHRKTVPAHPCHR